jgi:hypothetical protein
MAVITIRGASDDLIEIEGDIREEFSVIDEWRWLHFDDGTVVKIGYALMPGKGWHVEVARTGDGTETIDLTPIHEDGFHYYDQVQLTGEITSVECWRGPDGPTTEDVEKFWEDFDPSDYTDDQLEAARRALTLT